MIEIKKKLTIFTPSFNRSEKLRQLYKSLCKQSSKEFEWIIIDDGSTDNTSQLLKEFINPCFKVSYFYKNNGGKHTAINFGLEHVNTELVMIVDSDDTLTTDAVEVILNVWNENKKSKIANMIFLKEDTNGNISGFEFEKNIFVDNYNNYILANSKRSESADIWVTEILKKYPYPVFNGEKYVAETTVWSKISRKYDTIFVNKVIYIFEYQPEGLTSVGRKMRLQNPNGSMENALVIMNSNISAFLNLKNMILFISYGLYSKTKIHTLYSKAPNKFIFIFMIPIGFLLSKYWEKTIKVSQY